MHAVLTLRAAPPDLPACGPLAVGGQEELQRGSPVFRTPQKRVSDGACTMPLTFLSQAPYPSITPSGA
jgi:hypothetical protein